MPALTSIIIVAADSGATLEACVARVLASSARIELIVADNASTDGAIERLQQRFAADDRLRILRNEKNLGFGPACNLAASQARGDAVLFLNPDCFIEADSIARLRDVSAQQNDVGLIGVCICEPDGRPARAIRRRDPLLRRALMSFSGLSRWENRWPALQGVEMPPLAAAKNASVENVEAVSGALMFVSREVFEKIGGFDPGYFLHCEDIDLCRRVRDAGYRVLFASDLRVIHRQGSSSRHRPVFVARHKHHGMWRWFRKFDPAARNPLLRAIVWLGIWAHFVIVWPRLIFSMRRQRRAA
ncbi:glycosyltransferase family 2 protein [Pseudolysobacter antarcticus]|uniref:glycosyltransferase family 2 protein n=1 Tax=Pseudolysobacter antarcticus TaxID=2511995 RepID=UPI001F5C1E33|nr:glycosyltransferase family 2 protein [Pseudolysobacter antarcticus]